MYAHLVHTSYGKVHTSLLLLIGSVIFAWLTSVSNTDYETTLIAMCSIGHGRLTTSVFLLDRCHTAILCLTLSQNKLAVQLLLTLLLTLCGLASQKTHRRGLGLGGSVHEEAHPCFPYLVQPSFKGIDAGSI